MRLADVLPGFAAMEHTTSNFGIVTLKEAVDGEAISKIKIAILQKA